MGNGGAANIRIATFNVENLFSRVTFPDTVAPGEDHVGIYQFDDPEERKLARRIVEAAASDDKRQLTALALIECRADVVCLQEVDNAHALKVFYERYVKPHLDTAAAAEKKLLLKSARAAGREPTLDEIRAIDRRHYFDWRIVIEGNDGRGIDVGLMSKYPLKVTSHASRTFADLGVWSDELTRYVDATDGRDRQLTRNDKVFKRDCLEVDIDVDGRMLTVFVCHLKSMTPDRERTRPIRYAEALAVRRLVEARYGADVRDAPWLICGDFNDFTEVDGEPEVAADGVSPLHALAPLLDPDFAVDLVRRRDALDRWTTYHAPGDIYSQLDFILASPALARGNPDAVPDIIRAGQPYRVRRYTGPRYPRIGFDRPKASDHCPVAVELRLA